METKYILTDTGTVEAKDTTFDRKAWMIANENKLVQTETVPVTGYTVTTTFLGYDKSLGQSPTPWLFATSVCYEGKGEVPKTLDLSTFYNGIGTAYTSTKEEALLIHGQIEEALTTQLTKPVDIVLPK